jgi:hypothetical protein
MSVAAHEHVAAQLGHGVTGPAANHGSRISSTQIHRVRDEPKVIDVSVDSREHLKIEEPDKLGAVGEGLVVSAHWDRRGKDGRRGRSRVLVSAWLLIVLALLAAVGAGSALGFVLASRGQGGQVHSTAAAAPTTAATVAPTPSAPTTIPQQTTTQPVTTRTATTGAKTTPSRTSLLHADSPLKQHDALPAGVEAVMAQFIGGAGGGTCQDLDAPHQPAVSLQSTWGGPMIDAVVVGEPVLVCFLYFQAGATIQWQLTAPDGSNDQHTFCFLCEAGESGPGNYADLQDWESIPGDPVGSYQIAATQGDTKVTATFTLQHGSQPLFRVLDKAVLGVKPVGSTIHIVLAGFQAHQRVNLLLYYEPEGAGQGKYITSVPVGTDATGEMVYPLHTQPGDPKGCYVVRTQPSVDLRELPYDATTTDVFCLR